ncbi:MAG: PhoPQ-activated protein PqaA family protein [Pseudomonadota bacterium]
MRPIRILPALILATCVGLTTPFKAQAQARGGDAPTPLETYVHTPDPAYAYSLTQTIPLGDATAYVILMDSLRWRSDTEVDRTLWTHQVVIIVPNAVSAQTALLIINGGSDPNDDIDPLILLTAATLATQTGSVVAAVSQIPNQPLLFADEPEPIREDALVAYSWNKLAETGQPEWAAYLPMTKASVRAMDTVQEFVDQTVAGVTINDFVVTGFSKRGATAWLTAAADPRVRAVAPGVFDVLDIPLQIERHYRAYGFYAPAVEDYVTYGIVDKGRSPEGRLLASIVDPLSYADLLAMPKFLLNSTGDQFFLPDAAQFYAGELPGETLIYQIPNTDHGFTNGIEAALDALLGWYGAILNDSPRPAVNWQLDAQGTLVVETNPPATSATLWQATNPQARDFRLEEIGAVWSDTQLAPASAGRFEVSVPPPAAGFTGYLVVLAFADSGQTYSTPVFITPDTLPFVLDDSLLTPRRPWYWRCQVNGEPPCPRPDYLPSEIQALLPFSVFGTYQVTLEQLDDTLRYDDDLEQRARRACAAVRLNIAAGEAGWYTSPKLIGDPGRLLWETYERAEARAAEGDFGHAARLCQALNGARAR